MNFVVLLWKKERVEWRSLAIFSMTKQYERQQVVTRLLFVTFFFIYVLIFLFSTLQKSYLRMFRNFSRRLFACEKLLWIWSLKFLPWLFYYTLVTIFTFISVHQLSYLNFSFFIWINFLYSSIISYLAMHIRNAKHMLEELEQWAWNEQNKVI